MKTYEGEINRSYYTASEVAEMMKETAGVIRHWNEVFELGAHMGRQHRLYTRDIIAKLHIIQTLLRVDKFTTEGAKQKLEEQRKLNQLIK